jgi:hypothetical protein
LAATDQSSLFCKTKTRICLIDNQFRQSGNFLFQISIPPRRRPPDKRRTKFGCVAQSGESLSQQTQQFMTPFRNFSKYPSWKHRARRGGLYVAVATILAANAGCGDSDSGNGSDWEEVTVQEPTKGVITTLEETEPGKFSIVNEELAETREASRVIVKRLSGSTDTLTLLQAKSFVQPQDTVNNGGHAYRSHGMGGVLWWGMMGYMMGRNLGAPVNPAFYGRGYTGNPNLGSELQRTSVPRKVLRPVGGKSGFFKGSSRGRTGG